MNVYTTHVIDHQCSSWLEVTLKVKVFDRIGVSRVELQRSLLKIVSNDLIQSGICVAKC